ncbi:MAG: hydrolase [Bacillota bacterium]|jgi:altronate dehydratase small subunit|nr:hydrolase [Bacillota bacterium]
MVNAVIMNPKDTVVTVTKYISFNEDVEYKLNKETYKIKALSNIPMNHKIAIKDIEKGEAILKYGETIGYATDNINSGHYVHTHNLSSNKIIITEVLDEN